MTDFDLNTIFLTKNFEETAIALFNYQYTHNELYKNFVDALKVNVSGVSKITEIPFLPISFFKTHEVKTTSFEAEQIFTSSGTTGSTTSKHFVKNEVLYQNTFTNGWNQFYQPIQDFCVIGLLPSYLERSGSSLVYMVQHFINESTHELSEFYLDEHEHLYLILNELEKDETPTLLIGVTYALMDFAAKFKMNLKHTIVMETGGMKGRRKELTRTEVHDYLKQHLGCTQVHSEYGMTELLSQAYSKQDGIFTTAHTMKALVRAEDNPMAVQLSGKGLLNIIDLANVYSCAFIATDDLAEVHSNGTFTINGRADAADVRGCSLLTVE
jgi:phenylacetate-coenzyme A ligase PaaK-like adenylate-forming protein